MGAAAVCNQVLGSLGEALHNSPKMTIKMPADEIGGLPLAAVRLPNRFFARARIPPAGLFQQSSNSAIGDGIFVRYATI